MSAKDSFEKKAIKKKAKELGFDLITFTDSKIPQLHIDAYKNFIKEKMAGPLKYLKNSEARTDLNKILPETKSVICLATNYFHNQKKLSINCGRIARYAYGRDYHKVIKNRLIKMEEYLHTIWPNVQTRSFVDAVPLLERAFAEKSGMGIIGKNACLITKKYGSWVFLSEILITKKITPDKKISPENFSVCGSCELCINSCPTKAIISPGVIDPRKCLSYWTIENKSKNISPKIKKILKKEMILFGCDKCQECCPHNSRAKSAKDKELTDKKIAGDEQNINKLLALKNEKDFLNLFAGSALTRAKIQGIKRNANAIKRISNTHRKKKIG